MKLKQQLILAAITVMVAAPLSVMAASADTSNQGYVVNGNNSVNMRSGYETCVRTGSWNASHAAEPCAAGPKQVAAAPAPQAPAPVMVAAIPAAKPVPQKISFSGDALFDFDKAELKPAGKLMLDDLVNQIDGATYDEILATGHTDRFGSAKYNQDLSERRAQVVKDYLVSKNVRAAKVSAAGKGATQPMTQADACRGAKSTEVVSCLQPDRRVDVEMIGTKPATAL